MNLQIYNVNSDTSESDILKDKLLESFGNDLFASKLKKQQIPSKINKC